MITRQLVASYFVTISVCLFCLFSLQTTTAFTGQQCLSISMPMSKSSKTTSLHSAPSAADSAAAMTEFMAKAHEEKVKAMARVEDKYRGQITELEDKIAELEVLSKQTTPTSGNSFAFPATNKDLTDKVQSYRTFISDYIVKAQDEKATAVKTTEANLTAKYEAIIDGLKSAQGKE